MRASIPDANSGPAARSRTKPIWCPPRRAEITAKLDDNFSHGRARRGRIDAVGGECSNQRRRQLALLPKYRSLLSQLSPGSVVGDLPRPLGTPTQNQAVGKYSGLTELRGWLGITLATPTSAVPRMTQAVI
jgi:hypothetical protein